MYTLCGLGVCALILMGLTIRLERSAFFAQRHNMSLVCAFMGTLVLSLATMHPEQPVALTMDMVSFGFYEGGMPASVRIQFEEATRQDVLLVPIHTRVVMGMLGLWGSMILIALLFVVPLLRNIGKQPWLKYAYWVPPILSMVIFGLWLQSNIGTFSQDDFAQYLTEFDLPAIKSITYPNEPWRIHRPIGLMGVVGALLLLSVLMLRIRLSGELNNAPRANRASQFSGLAILGMTILTMMSPNSVNYAGQWTAIACLMFAVITLVEARGGLKVWSSLCCLIVAGMGWSAL